MEWLKIFAQLLPVVFGLVPALRAHTQTAVDASQAVADSLALPGATQGSVKNTVLSVVSDGVAVANDELVAAGKDPLDAAAIVHAASSATDTAISLTNIAHAVHGTGAAPTSATA